MNQKQWSSGLMSALMACTGGAILVVHSANHFGYSERQLLTWLFVCYTVAGLFNLLIAWRYRMPFAGAHSITSIAFLSTASVQLTLPQLAGSFVMSGIIVLLLGVTGIFNVLFKHIPRPVIDAMLAGIIAHFVIELVPAFQANPIVGLLAVIGFFVTPRLFKVLPAIVGVIVLGLIGLLITYSFPAAQKLSFQLPQLIAPEFTWQGLISIAIPISVLVLSNDIAVAMAALNKQDYQPPVNRIISLSGIASSLSGFMLGHSINVGGMMTTVCSSDDTGEKTLRYRAGMLSSFICILFGLFAWLFIPYITLLPDYFIAIIIGFSLLGIFLNSMGAAFSNPDYRYSVLVAFVISISGIAIFGISAALWALVLGTLASKLLGEHKLVQQREQ